MAQYRVQGIVSDSYDASATCDAVQLQQLILLRACCCSFFTAGQDTCDSRKETASQRQYMRRMSMGLLRYNAWQAASAYNGMYCVPGNPCLASTSLMQCNGARRWIAAATYDFGVLVVATGLFSIEILAQCPGGAWRTLSEWEIIFKQAGMELRTDTAVGCNMNLMVFRVPNSR